MPHLDDDRLALVRRLYEASELTIAEIAVLADVSESAIYQRVRREQWTSGRRPGVTPRRTRPRPPVPPTPALIAIAGHGHGRGHGRDDDREDGRQALQGDEALRLDRAATARRLWLAVDRHLEDLETYGGPEGMIRAAQNLATLARTLETLVDVERGLATGRAGGRAGDKGNPPVGGTGGWAVYPEPGYPEPQGGGAQGGGALHSYGEEVEAFRAEIARRLEGLMEEDDRAEADAFAADAWALSPAACAGMAAGPCADAASRGTAERDM